MIFNRVISIRFRPHSALYLPALLLLQACAAVGPDYEPPDITPPDAWSEKVAAEVEAGPQASLQNWWSIFNDPELDALIEQARLANLDLKLAVSRVRESRAMLAIARGEKQPELNATGSASISKLSDDGALQQIAPEGGFKSNDMLSLGVDAAWEIDVFGGIRRSIEAAGAAYQASVEEYRDVMVSLYAEVALAYLDIRSHQQRILFARANADSQQQSLDFARDRFDSGVASKLDVLQAKANLLATESTIPALQIGLNQAINRLAVLLGKDAGSLQSRFHETGPLPQAADLLSVGVPADVLRQRPDIRKAERMLAAQTAEIGVATAELYPSFSLAGFFGLQSRSLSNLFDSSSFAYGIQAPVQWSLLNGDRVRGNIEVQKEKTQQRLLIYENQVLLAVEEVENAIAAFNLNGQQSEILENASVATRDAVDLVMIQYNTGLTGFNNVLITQRDLFDLQDQLVITRAEVSANVIGLYKALGGGWNVNEAVQLDTSDAP